MRENSLRNNLSPDHETMDETCRTELTVTDSDSDSSAITVESLHLKGNAAPQGQSAKWTNEKHNAYIDFLETSFVQQLQESTGFSARHSQGQRWGPYSSQALSANPRSSSGQLMVLRNGCWQKIKSGGNEPLYDNAAVSSDGGQENPWIRHFTSVGKHRTATTFYPQDMNISCEPPGASEQRLDCLQNSVGSPTEVSDQNFVDEDQGRTSFGPMAGPL